MKLFVDIVTTFLLLFWPLVLFTSVMMFDAPGSTNNTSLVITVMLIVAYPVYIFLLYALVKSNYFGLSSRLCLIIATLTVLGALFLFGYFDLLWKGIRGIESENTSNTELVDSDIEPD